MKLASIPSLRSCSRCSVVAAAGRHESQLFVGGRRAEVSSNSFLASFLPSKVRSRPSVRPSVPLAPSSFFPVGRLRRRHWENGSVQLAVTLVAFAAVVVRAVVIQGAAVIQFKEEGRLKWRRNLDNVTAEFSWSTLNRI